ncbi:MAG: hypothetical protein ETSY2_15710 [Candidatus Entotheonella gemina]|uniref:Soluble ligand binding domain-containing protein n=2 Tax=Candidatus Entotheonella TaxID=93171 RepID=W4M9T0_9BACT|nr:MAG: hypothetical protein ETSY2_15710 [Candidatus Entotheonella gemina]
MGSGDLARREEVVMATFQSRSHQRQWVLRARRFSYTMYFFLAIVLVGCAPQLPYAPPVPPQHLQQLANQFELTNRLQEMTLSSYTLDVGDKILVRVDGSRPVSREVTVDPQGTITYPRVGRIKVAGLTLPELDRSLGSSLAGNARKARRVTTTITKYRNQHVYILGEVRVPGVHPLQPSLSLLELITQAGGPTPEAGWLALLVKKNGKAPVNFAPASQKNGSNSAKKAPHPTAVRIDLDELLIGETATSLRIESGDTIYIPEAAHFFIYGEVERPGRYRLKRGMTAIQAISNAGGYTAYAAKKRLQVFRYHVHDEECGGDLCLWGFAKHVTKEPPKEYRLHLHDRLQPADVLVVPAHFGL